MRKISIALILIIVLSESFGQKKGAYYKCMPFNTSSVIPIAENDFLKKKVDNKYIFEKKISNPKVIIELENIFNRIILKKHSSLEDYDIRMFISLSNKIYFFNWDKKYIIYQEKNYEIESKDFNNILKLLNCKCS